MSLVACIFIMMMTEICRNRVPSWTIFSKLFELMTSDLDQVLVLYHHQYTTLHLFYICLLVLRRIHVSSSLHIHHDDD